MKVVAWKVEENLRCDVCGTRREEWKEDRHAYLPDVWRCHGCEILESEQDAVSKDMHEHKGSSQFGFKFGLRKPD